jgi:hypothetical protein
MNEYHNRKIPFVFFWPVNIKTQAVLLPFNILLDIDWLYLGACFRKAIGFQEALPGYFVGRGLPA